MKRRFKAKILLVLGLFLASFLVLGCPQKKPQEITPKEKKEGGKKMFVLKSSGFKDGERMPSKYANKGVAGGENVSPPLEWENPPEETKSFALAMVDHHPVAGDFVHWLVIDIPANVNSIEGGASDTAKMPAAAKELNTSYGTPSYGGPRPPAGTGDHPYETTIYALNTPSLDLGEDITLDEFLNALEGKILAKASLTGMFSQ